MGGMRATGSGYPNAANTLRILRELGAFEIIDLGKELPQQLHLWRLAKARLSLKLAGSTKLVVGNLVSAVRILRRARGAKVWVYVPYPCIFFLLWMSLVPTKWRPNCIADAYISIWDSAFRDRSNSKGRGLVSRLVKAIEARALGVSQYVLVDTTANREMFIREFRLRPLQVEAFPLALPPGVSKSQANLGTHPRETLRVLFLGTFVPLHGVDVILEGLTELLEQPGVEFRFVGDGQDAGLMSSFLEKRSSAPVTWERGWLEFEQMMTEIWQADICIGVFGGEGKAARVLPLKLYHYLAAGRPVITQNDYSLPAETPGLDGVVVLSSRTTLAKDLDNLIKDAELRQRLGRASSMYFQLHLSDAAIIHRWQRLLGT